MSLPFFDALHTYFPQSRVDIIARPSIQDVFLQHPAVYKIHPFLKSQTQGLPKLFQYGRALQKGEHYDVFFTLAPSFSSALIGYGVGSCFRIGYAGEGRSLLLTHRISPTPGIHRVQLYYHLFEHFYSFWKRQTALASKVNDSQETYPHRLHFPFSTEEDSAIFLSKETGTQYIVFNVNSEAQSRRLPLEKWTALGNRLLNDNTQKWKIVFIGTVAEQSRVRKVMQEIEPSEALLDFSGKTSLRQLARLLHDVDIVLSNDSGPMHLANAVGTPVVTFFGAGDPAETGPFNSQNALVINKHVTCSPCVKNQCRFPTVRCLEQITIDELYQSVVKLI